MTTGSGPSGPLAGIRVVELATVIMAPFGAQLLGDLGADVIKVETGGGDGSRVMGGGPHPELSGIALNLHRNKRSIAVDLKQARGRDVLLRLLVDADVLITNLRPGPLRRLGLDHESLRGDFPRLVYCQAQGFRTSSDEADLPAYDDIIQALTGFPQLNALGFGAMHFVPSTVADKVAGMFIAQGVLAALVARSVSGVGQRVEVPMFDAALAFNLVEHLSRAAVAGEEPGYGRVLTAHRGPHRTADGWVAMMPYTDAHWTALFAAVGEERLLEHEWFTDHRSRLLHADEVYGLLASILVRRTTAEWVALGVGIGVPVSVVPALQEIVDDPAHHRGVLREAEHPVVGPYRSIAAPVLFSESGTPEPQPAPLVGADTATVLAGAGFGADEIAALLADGVVRGARQRSSVEADPEGERPGSRDDPDPATTPAATDV
jgi:crotonobetainyl-CoA:carnitine CoA-transferase CaiB-like acyl-CoA transferase